MRKLLVVVLIVYSWSAYAQEKAIAKIHYMFKHINDSTKKENFLRDEVVTYLGQEGSFYTSYSGTRSQEQITKQMSDPTFDGNLVISSSYSPIKESFLFLTNGGNPTLKKVAQVASDKFLVETQYPSLDWTVQEETKDIGGYSAQKATTTYKGRNYTAWFTSEIPFPYGPWKLQGLPGLILSASDDKNEVVFDYQGFDKLDDNTTFIINDTDQYLPSTDEEVAKLQKAFRENPNAYLQSKANSSSRNAIVVRGSSSGGKLSTSVSSSGSPAMDPSKIKSMTVKKDDNYKPSNTTNNPIELKP